MPFASVAGTVIDAGAVTTGAVRSAMVSTAVAEAVRPEESAILKVTVVSPRGNTSGASFAMPSVTVPSTLSVELAEAIHSAIAASVLAVPPASVAAIVASSTVITGGD